jgi:L-alanine-DL-glutamate epimerase-like enolase superfamily enzyme
MKITAVDIRACHRSADRFPASALRGGNFHGFDFLVITLKTDTGLSASMFGFAGRSAMGAAHQAADVLRPCFMGRDPMERERLWHDFRVADRWWAHQPIYAYGPFDVCLWLLGALAANQPLYQYLGAARSSLPTYVSSMVLPEVQDYALEALAARAAGFKGYKLHTPGKSFTQDLLAHRLVREAIGTDPDFSLMSDPVGNFNLEQAVKFGRALEQLDYHWLEEPLADEHTHALRELSRVLDIPVVGTEVLAKHPYSVAECVSQRVVDRVRADVSWSGGVTGTMKTAHLAEAFGMNCELHTTIFLPLELANLHVAAAVNNCEFFEMLGPTDSFNFGLAEPFPIKDGRAYLPSGPGLGIELDWDEIERCTLAKL